MATFELESSLNSLQDSTILPNYEGHPVVQAKIVDFSVFKTYNARQVYDALSTFFVDPDMLVIAHSDSPACSYASNDLGSPPFCYDG